MTIRKWNYVRQPGTYFSFTINVMAGYMMGLFCYIVSPANLLSTQDTDEKGIVTRKKHRVLVQCTRAPWDPGVSTWFRWLPPCHSQAPLQGGMHMPAVYRQKDLRLPCFYMVSVVASLRQPSTITRRDAYASGVSTQGSSIAMGPWTCCQGTFDALAATIWDQGLLGTRLG